MINLLTKVLRRRFGFSRNEIYGLFLLIPLIIMILAIPNIYRAILISKSPPSFEIEKELIEEWRKEIVIEHQKKPLLKVPKKKFNPNTINKDGLAKLGFKPVIVDRIINYRSKGGFFKQKRDLLKIYGINKELVNYYLDCISIPKPQIRPKSDSKQKYKLPNHVVSKKSVTKIKLNTSDANSLQTIKGIGPYWSNRIVKYRKALGGFVNKGQVYEIYGLKKELAEIIVKNVELGPSSMRQISINQDSIGALAKHPYISYQTANSIIKYRRQHGNYEGINELREIVTISDSLYQKISPYLTTR